MMITRIFSKIRDANELSSFVSGGGWLLSRSMIEYLFRGLWYMAVYLGSRTLSTLTCIVRLQQAVSCNRIFTSRQPSAGKCRLSFLKWKRIPHATVDTVAEILILQNNEIMILQKAVGFFTHFLTMCKQGMLKKKKRRRTGPFDRSNEVRKAEIQGNSP